MLNLPGVQISWTGSEKKARSFIPFAFRILNERRGLLSSVKPSLAIDRLERHVRGAVIEIKIFNNLASIHIDASEIEVEKDVTISEQKREDELIEEIFREKDYFIRLYVHADVILKTSFASITDQLVRSDVGNALAAAIWDPDSRTIRDIRSSTIPYMNIFDPFYYPPDGLWYGEDWRGMVNSVSNDLNEIIGWYEDNLPSERGPCRPVYNLTSLIPYIKTFRCLDDQYIPPWDTDSGGYPWFFNSLYDPGPDANQTWNLPGCDATAFRSFRFGTDEETLRAPHYKSLWTMAPGVEAFHESYSDGLHVHADAIGEIEEFIHSYKSGIYGLIWDGLLRRKEYQEQNNAWYVPGAPRSPYIVNGLTPLPNNGPIVNGEWYGQGLFHDFGFENSWILPNGEMFYGEAFHMNWVECDANYVTNGLTTGGIININATMGRDVPRLLPAALLARDETIDATAAFKQLLELAITTAGGFTIDPTTLNYFLRGWPSAPVGGEVDIRSLSGTVAGSPIFNVKFYAIPLLYKDVTRTRKEFREKQDGR